MSGSDINFNLNTRPHPPMEKATSL